MLLLVSKRAASSEDKSEILKSNGMHVLCVYILISDFFYIFIYRLLLMTHIWKSKSIQW